MHANGACEHVRTSRNRAIKAEEFRPLRKKGVGRSGLSLHQSMMIQIAATAVRVETENAVELTRLDELVYLFIVAVVAVARGRG